MAELIEAARLNINLSVAVIEKDYYVTQTIYALSSIENEYFRLVFCGGTCLAKAHKIVNRVSEDVDFKIQIKNNENFVAIAKSIILNDAKQFKNQHPEYSANPEVEMKESLTLLRNKPNWEERYQDFIENMVYDKTTALEYENALDRTQRLTHK